ncbi:MAG: NINE protein [Bacteroidota bacterium]
MKDKYVAAILAFLLGAIGIHRFYLGQAGLGILYLLFCWTFIPAVAAFIDFIVFLVMSEESFDKKYNAGVSQSRALTRGQQAVRSKESNFDKLEKIARLRESGALSEDEFQEQKAIILDKENGFL